jgi:hypothetical protein
MEQVEPNYTASNHNLQERFEDDSSSAYFSQWYDDKGLGIFRTFYKQGMFQDPIFDICFDHFFTDTQKKAILEVYLANVPKIQDLAFSERQFLRVLGFLFSEDSVSILFPEILPILSYYGYLKCKEQHFWATELKNDVSFFASGQSPSIQFAWVVIAQNQIPDQYRESEIKLSLQEHLKKQDPVVESHLVIGSFCLVPDNSTVYVQKFSFLNWSEGPMFFLTYRQLAKRILEVAQLEHFKNKRWLLEDLVSWIERKAP